MQDLIDHLLRCNRTELQNMCRRAGTPFDPAWTKDTLAKALLGMVQASRENPIDSMRDGIMRYLIDHRRSLSAQITCPARSFDPKACYGCPDARPIHCFITQHPATQTQMEMRRKP